MDQDERVMSLLDVVDGVVEELRAKRIEDERNEMTKNQMLSRLRPGDA